MAKKILVIENDSAILEFIKIILEEQGFDVIAGCNCDTLDKLNGALPDLIILDFNLPKKCGGEITKHLKKQKNTKNIPVIIMSAHHNLKNIAKKSGADSFLAKPFDLDDFLGLVNKYLV